MFSYSLIGWCNLFVYFVSHVCIISSINKITKLHVTTTQNVFVKCAVFVILMNNEQWEANIWCNLYQIEKCHTTCLILLTPFHEYVYKYNSLLQPNVRVSMLTNCTNCTWSIFFVLRSTHIIFGIHHQTNPKTRNFLTCFT